MQGNKTDDQKLFYQFSLQSRIPEGNFYRRLKTTLDFSFLKKQAAPLYGKCGKQSIDTAVFFKMALVGYLENITTDRQLVVGMRKVNTHGIDLAHKSMIMSAIAYNLKKYMKYCPKTINIKVESTLHSLKKLKNIPGFLFFNNFFRFSIS